MYNKKIKNPAPSCTGVMFHEFQGKKIKKLMVLFQEMNLLRLSKA